MPPWEDIFLFRQSFFLENIGKFLWHEVSEMHVDRREEIYVLLKKSVASSLRMRLVFSLVVGNASQSAYSWANNRITSTDSN